MGIARFPFTSDQLELLLEFESREGLNELARALGKDPSVISRGLQRLSETSPVLVKQKGRWRLTELGKQVNQHSRAYLTDLLRTLPPSQDRVPGPVLGDRALLLVINAQIALLDPGLGPRNNPDAEKNIRRLLDAWRARRFPVAHVQHVMDDPASPFHLERPSAGFIPLLAPHPHEMVFQKAKASAFSGTALADRIAEKEIDTVVLTGFTANECIDATAKQAHDLGLATCVVSDATAMFDVGGPHGNSYKAERVHGLVMANLQAFFARVVETPSLLRQLVRL